jgi:hypothetical protein
MATITAESSIDISDRSDITQNTTAIVTMIFIVNKMFSDF